MLNCLSERRYQGALSLFLTHCLFLETGSEKMGPKAKMSWGLSQLWFSNLAYNLIVWCRGIIVFHLIVLKLMV